MPPTHDDDALARDDFAALALDEQLALLERSLGARRASPRALLERAAGLRDAAPLAWLCARLLGTGYLLAPDERAWFARFLLAQPDTAVHQALRAATARLAAVSLAEREALCAALLEALAAAPLERIAAVCLIDRALKAHYPLERERFVAGCTARCADAVRVGRVDAIPLALLAQVPARELLALRELAATVGARDALDALHARLAAATIAVLGAAPKALSQSNAEELLSRRVYTDPGHFLVELLQNAEDAGATSFRVRFEPERVVVVHDGAPFDARDLVGVTSIGQTTKRQQQIGFFGVGFKSVYEVTDRPQVHSGVYRFEIADVSIPRALSPSSSPADVARGATALVLPLRDPRDPARSPRALYERACALDPCVLLTLRSIAHLELELDARAAGGPARRAMRETPVEARGDEGPGSRVRVREEPAGREREYLLVDDEFRYPGHDREPGRPDRTRVMVGVRVGADGVPEPLDRGAPTVYSYLPTAEASGLRFFVQGHFDVPVDRERVAPDSAWNKWIVARLPSQLGRAAERVARSGDARRARGLLDVLPLEREVASTVFRPLASALATALGATALVPCTDGALHAPRDALIAAAPIAALFDGDPDGARALFGRGAFADPSLPPRSLELLRALGCAELDARGLLAALERMLANVSDGSHPPAPGWLARTEPARVARLLAVLGEAVEREPPLLERVRALPVVPAAGGGLFRARGTDGPVRAPTGVRALFAGMRPLLDPALDPLAGGEAVLPAANALLERLGVPSMDLGAAIDELAAGRGPLRARLGDAVTRDALLALCAGASHELLARAARLPLFAASDGGLWPAATHASDARGVLRVADGANGERLRAFYRGRRPLLAPEAQSGPAGVLLERLGAPVLDAAALVQDVVARPAAFVEDPGALRALHALLEALDDELAERDRRLLGTVPVWPDRRGVPRALRGPSRAYRAAHEALLALFPAAPFLDADIAARAHVAACGAETVGPDAVVLALSPDAPPPLRIEPSPVLAGRALAYLAAHADAVGPRARDALATLPVFPPDRGATLHALADLLVAQSPALRAIYGDGAAARRRYFLDAEGPAGALLRALGLFSRVPVATVATLADDLAGLAEQHAGRPPSAATPLVPDRPRLDALHAFLVGELAAMPRAVLDRLANLAAVYPDESGKLCRLGDLRRGVEPSRVYPCDDGVRPVLRAAGVRLMDPRAQAALAPLLAAARVPTAKLDLALELIRPLPRLLPGQPPSALQSPSLLAHVQALLVEHRDSLLSQHPPSRRGGALPDASTAIASLCIWATVGGAVVCADELVDAVSLDALMEPGTSEHRALDAVRLDAAAWQRFSALDPLVAPRPAEQVLEALVARHARPSQPLASQPKFLASLERVARIAARLAQVPPAALASDPPVRPLVDALGRVRLDVLRSGDEATVRLLNGLALEGELVHPGFAVPDAWREARVKPLGALEVLSAVLDAGGEGVRRSPAKRDALFAWLVEHEREVFSHNGCRELLSGARVFPTERGTFLLARDLVTDPALPDLGVDWRPSPSIPREALALLERHLGAGRPPADELVRAHLRPAYLRTVAARDAVHAGAILRYTAALLAGRPRADVVALLRPEATDWLLEDSRGGFVPSESMVLPSPELAPHVEAVWGASYPVPSPSRYPAEVHRLLVDLGVRTEPSLERVRAALGSPGREPAKLRGLCALLGALRRARGPELVDALALRTTAWLPDGTGCARPPSELFLPGADVEALVGAFPELVPDPAVLPLLGEPLVRELGLRTARDATLEEVLRHLEARCATKSPAPFRIYQWLDSRLRAGAIDPAKLASRLAGRRWVQADDGAYFPHAKVLGVWAHQYFGARRGYWERGRVECPALCAAVGIGAEVTPAHVEAFLLEVGADVTRDGDAAVLSREPALPKMLLACYARMAEGGRSIGRDVPVVLAAERSRRGDGRGATVRLVRADAPSLVRSDTPTLEALFESAGPLLVAQRGAPEDRERIDRFYTALGVRRLRDAYTVAVDADAGRDVTAERAEQVATLRGVLRALCAVLPRVRARRGREGDAAWVFERRLRPLASSGALRAVERLRVRYRLEGVGETRDEVPAAFDRARGALLVDTRVLDEPDAQASGLAAGLLPAIHDGPGDDALVDMVEILLPLATAERMNAYLDRRHFPVVETALDARDAIAERVGELLDYGIDRRLAARFAPLRDADTSRWREPGLLAKLDATGERSVVAARAARALLDAVGAVDGTPSVEAMRATLAALLAAPSLRQIPTGLLGPALVPGATSAAADDDVQPAPFELPADYFHVEPAPPPSPPPAFARATPSTAPPPAPVVLPEPEPEGLFRRVLGWLGLEREPASAPALPAPATPPPDWARADANTLAPLGTVGSQLWATPAERARVAQAPARTFLGYAPPSLPSPHLYAVSLACATFEPATQSWSPRGVPGATWFGRGRRSGRVVVFEGAVAPGRSRLPMPLHSALASAPVVTGERASVRVVEGSSLEGGDVTIEVRGDGPVALRYAVELLEPPALTAAGDAIANAPGELLAPTLPLRELPAELRRWIEREREREGVPDWALAIAARDFVRERYVYDDAFLTRDDVRTKRGSLRAGRGNHHLALLHASSDGEVLGRGICYELNVLVVEVLRHLGVPSMVAVGWVLDEGRLDRPDHLFALAVVPSPSGPTVLPLDASTTAHGAPIRPLGSRASSPAVAPVAQLPAMPAVAQPAGPWSTGAGGGDRWVTELASAENARLEQDCALLTTAIRAIAHALGQEAPAPPSPSLPAAVRAQTLSVTASRMLPDPALLGPLLALLRGEYQQVTAVPPGVQELVRLGLARLRTVPAFEILPVRGPR